MNDNAPEQPAQGLTPGGSAAIARSGNAPAGVPVMDVDPFSDAFLTDPYPDHERMREAGPVFWIPKYAIYASARHEQVRAILNDHATYISSAGVGLADFNKETPFRPRSLILEADPPDHTRARSVLARILSPRTVMQVRATFAAEAETLLDRLVEKARSEGEIDAVKDLSEVYPLKVFPDAVGLESEGREMLLLYGNMIFNAFGPRNELLVRAAEKVKPLTQWIMDHCKREMLRPGGFGDMIYQAADAGEISLDEAPLLVRSFLSAGVDTTVNGIGNALLCLAQHPEQYARLRADPSLARPAFEEALRYESAVQTFFRTTSVDASLSGITIPAGSKVLTFLAAANRDPRQWPDPERFDIERRPSGHMAFGSGIHGCVGQVVARLEGELILAGIAKRVKSLSLAGKPTRRLNNTLRALASLPLKLETA
ncbi:MAG: cytochrome P450 [Lautropia sp.]|nr:cytochrome P450 [Lautropia sp.]